MKSPMSGGIGVLAAGVGALADIIAVEGNPLNDLTVLQKVIFVRKAGRPIDLNTL